MPDSIIFRQDRQQETLTEDVQDLISHRPHWLVRKGNTLFLLIALLLLCLSWIIRYPDMITSSARLTSVNPPRLIVARTEGRLIRLFIENEALVRKGAHLGYMESTAAYQQVLQLQNWVDKIIDTMRSTGFAHLSDLSIPNLSALGELQPRYQDCQDQLEIARQTLADGYYLKKQAALNQDIAYLQTLKLNTRQQEQLQKQDQQLQQEEYDAYEKLAREKVIAPLELNQYKSRLLAKERNLEQLNAQVTNTEISTHGRRKELLELQKQIADQQQLFRSSVFELKSEIDAWIQKYVLVSPEDGRVLYTSALQENQLINSGDGLFYIEPKGASYYAEIMAGQKGLGKIKIGQQVMLRIDGYPSEEFGYLTAKVNYISEIPTRTDSFLIRAELQNGLKTNTEKNLFFRNGLTAEGQIVTDNRRLLGRILGSLNIFSR